MIGQLRVEWRRPRVVCDVCAGSDAVTLSATKGPQLLGGSLNCRFFAALRMTITAGGAHIAL